MTKLRIFCDICNLWLFHQLLRVVLFYVSFMHAAVEGPFVLNALHRIGCHVRVKFAIKVSVAKTLVNINLGYRKPVLIYF